MHTGRGTIVFQRSFFFRRLEKWALTVEHDSFGRGLYLDQIFPKTPSCSILKLKVTVSEEAPLPRPDLPENTLQCSFLQSIEHDRFGRGLYLSHMLPKIPSCLTLKSNMADSEEASLPRPDVSENTLQCSSVKSNMTVSEKAALPRPDVSENTFQRPSFKSNRADSEETSLPRPDVS